MMNTLDPWPTASPWFGAEGTRKGKPLLVRGRRLPTEVLGHADLPYILNMNYKYSPLDETGLPLPEQYDLIADFENRVLDVIEAKKQGLVTFIQTCDGVVRYVLYVRDSAAAAELVSQHLSLDDPVEMTAGKDDKWTEYKRLVAMVTE